MLSSACRRKYFPDALLRRSIKILVVVIVVVLGYLRVLGGPSVSEGSDRFRCAVYPRGGSKTWALLKVHVCGPLNVILVRYQ
jgi:hypothetical protein